MVKRFNVVAPKKYTKNNEEKTVWLNVGTITQFDNGNQILELNMNPSQTYQIFPQEGRKTQGAEAQEHPKEDVPTINIDEEPKEENPF